MLELVSVLMRVLVIEGALLLCLNVVDLILIIKQMCKNKEPIKNFKNIISEFKQKVYSNEKYSNICKATVVLYGVTKLTALWCLSILFGVVFAPNILVVIGILIAEILIIALQVRNKFVLSSEDVIDLKWMMLKMESFINKKLPQFSFKGSLEKVRETVYGCFKKENSAN